MDTLTHAVTGALIARAAGPAKPLPGQLSLNTRMTAGFLAAAFPDIDFALRLTGTLNYLNWHQGVTHSLILLPVWAWLLSLIFSWATSGRYSWREFYLPVFLGITIHIAGDVITAYGPTLLAPFSYERFYIPLVYVSDFPFTTIAIAGLVVAVLLPQWRYTATTTLLILAAYVGMQDLLRQRAIDFGQQYVQQQALTDAKVHALPQPLSPFNWMVIIQQEHAYQVALISLYRQHSPAPVSPEANLLRQISAAYQPLSTAAWHTYQQFGTTSAQQSLTRHAWHDDAFAAFRRFAMFPALYRIDRDNAATCVWFMDLRYQLPSLPPSFRFGLCREDVEDDWRLERLRGAFWID